MNITGTHRIDAPRQQVWEALHDPATLVRTLPGCESLEVTGPDTYAVVVTAGIASIRGSYRGEVVLSDKNEPDGYRMRVSGAGAPGTVDADVEVRLTDDDGATLVAYEAEAVIGGMIGGVGQRVIGGVARRTAGEFFTAVERHLHAPTETAATPAAGVATVTAIGEAAAPRSPTDRPTQVTDGTAVGEAQEQAEVQLGKVFRASASRPAGSSGAAGRSVELVGAVVTGGVLALAGVLVGRRLGRGRGSRG